MALKDEKILNGTQNEGNANQSTPRCQFLLSDWVTSWVTSSVGKGTVNQPFQHCYQQGRTTTEAL